MSDLKLSLNPQLYILQHDTNVVKSPEKIGKIYHKNSHVIFRQSIDLSNIHTHFVLPLSNKQIQLGQQLPLKQNKSLHFESKVSNEPLMARRNSNDLEINLITNKNFRINKISASQRSKFPKRQKTPELIGKLSSSRINEGIFEQESGTKTSRVSSNRSPGHFTSIKYHKKTSRQNILQPGNSYIQRFKQYIDQDLKCSQQLLQAQINPQNKRLIQQVKEKQQYLKNLIEKHRKNGSQLPVPRKNIQQYKYQYPVSSQNISKSQKNKKASPYLQKIQQNSKLLQGMMVQPRFLSKNKEKTSRPTLELGKGTVFNQGEQGLKRAISKEMRISPSVNVSFTIKSPRIVAVTQDKISLKDRDTENELNEWKLNLSKVSLYSPQKNADLNNRKPNHIQLLIDPLPKQLKLNTNFSQSASKTTDLSFLSNYFSRLRKLHLGFSQQKQTHFITLKTSISTIKQLLIESTQKANLHLLLPSVLFQNCTFNSHLSIKDIHLFIQKVYFEMKIKPQIVTIKTYKNAIFTGVLNSSSIDHNIFTSIIYHFTGQFYLGGWREAKNSSIMHKDKVEGQKHGIGFEISYQESKTSNNTQANQLIVDCYYGQFENNQKKGYGISFKSTFINCQICEQMMQIGCWKDSNKDGWVKSYINNQLEQNAEYEKGDLIRRRGRNSEEQVLRQ